MTPSLMTQPEAPPSAPETRSFTSYNDVLGATHAMCEARRLWLQNVKDDLSFETIHQRERRYRELRAEWHDGVRASPLPLCQRCVSHGLTELETELLWGMVSLSIGDGGDSTLAELLKQIAIEPRERLTAFQFLVPEAPLVKGGFLILGTEDDEGVAKTDVIADPSVIAEVVSCTSTTGLPYWSLNDETDLYDAMRPLYRLLDSNADAYVRHYARNVVFQGMSISFRRRSMKVQQEWEKVNATIKRYPSWSWNRPEVQVLSEQERRILLALSAAALDIIPESNDLFTGRGLMACLVTHIESGTFWLNMLSADHRLVREGWIRPASEEADHDPTSGNSVAATRFELDDRAFEILKLERNSRKTVSGVTLREPRISLDQLALSPQIEEAIRLTVTQARAEGTILREWGLAERIQYGLHPVLLFYGPPGTGKTATAEALAHELGRPLIVADYSQIQSCYVGATEKNIVRIFREAQRRKAVLFWDEADAMLFDRDDAVRSWEVRDVNVILQRIERFEGVCILATNRHQKLDKALARRISMQVEFQRPGSASERLRIWRAMLPQQLPLDSTVDLKAMAEEDLSAGEMKNVVLNAARFAAARGGDDITLTAADFAEAVRWETRTRQHREKGIGFCRASLR